MNLLNLLHEKLCVELNAVTMEDPSGIVEHSRCRLAKDGEIPDSIVLSGADENCISRWVREGVPNMGRWSFMLISTEWRNLHQFGSIRSDNNLKTFAFRSVSELVLVIFHGFSKDRSEHVHDANDLSELMSFIGSRKTKPRGIALAFIGKMTDERHGMLLRETRKEYELEVWERESSFSGFYNSFSQIINESVMQCESEFIFWVHPRVTVEFETLDRLVLLLCSGYAFVSEVSFGFFGCTKQLFRKIGLLDERFLGSEHEDTDWFFRMKKERIPFFERGNQQICPADPHEWSPMRGLAHTIFEEKWVRKHDDLEEWEWPYHWCLSKFYDSEKRFSDGKNRPDIESHWADPKDSYGSSFIPRLALSCSFYENDLDEKYENVEIKITLRFDERGFFSEFRCAKKTFVVITVHDMNGIVLARFRMLSNSWSSNNLDSVKDLESVEFRVNCGQYRVFHGFCKRNYHQLIDTEARIKTVDYSKGGGA